VPSTKEEQGRLCCPGIPDNHQHTGKKTIKEVVVVAHQDRKKHQRGTNTHSHRRLGNKDVPAKHEQRYPLQRGELQVSLGMHEVIVGKCEDAAPEEAAQVRTSEVVSQQERRPSSENIGEQHYDVVRLADRKKFEKRNRNETIVRIECMAKKGGSARVVNKICMPR